MSALERAEGERPEMDARAAAERLAEALARASTHGRGWQVPDEDGQVSADGTYDAKVVLEFLLEGARPAMSHVEWVGSVAPDASQDGDWWANLIRRNGKWVHFIQDLREEQQ